VVKIKILDGAVIYNFVLNHFFPTQLKNW